MFDFSEFFTASVKNAPTVILIVMGLVTLLGKFGVSGKAQLGSAAGIGLVIGGAFNIAALGLPVDYAGWFSTVMYGLMTGLTASLGYEVGKELATKAAAKALGIHDDLSKG